MATTQRIKKCDSCGSIYEIKNIRQRFCSINCRQYYHNNLATEKDMWKVRNVSLTEKEQRILSLIRDKSCKTVYQISQHTYLVRSNLYRILGSLEYKGYIRKLSTTPASWEYSLGADRK